jgi:hypothetical protein
MELDLIKVDSSSNSARFAQATTTGQLHATLSPKRSTDFVQTDLWNHISDWQLRIIP